MTGRMSHPPRGRALWTETTQQAAEAGAKSPHFCGKLVHDDWEDGVELRRGPPGKPQSFLVKKQLRLWVDEQGRRNWVYTDFDIGQRRSQSKRQLFGLV